jgi:hypothetical protein
MLRFDRIHYSTQVLIEIPGQRMKLGQTWLLDKHTYEAYLENANHTQDKRFGPKQFKIKNFAHQILPTPVLIPPLPSTTHYPDVFLVQRSVLNVRKS